jgi:hypothetical protein
MVDIHLSTRTTVGIATVPANFVIHLQLFEFAKNHRGLYQNSVPSVRSFYSSSGDEVHSKSLINTITKHRSNQIQMSNNLFKAKKN